MKRKRWAEARIMERFPYVGPVFWRSVINVRGRPKFGRIYYHRRSARRAAIQWAKRNGYELRWV